LADRVLLMIVYLLVRRILGLAVLVVRGDRAKDAELLVLRHENAVLRRHAGRVRYESADRVWLAALLALTLGERFGDIKFLIRDCGSNFTASSDAVFQASGTRILRTAVRVPRMNAICERLVGTLRRELLDRVLIIGERHLQAVLTEYQAHYTRPGRTRASPNAPPMTNLTFPAASGPISTPCRSAEDLSSTA
jgi:transposase InsO family protein